MNVSFIYFDNDLDIAPGPDEEFTYNLGDLFIKHWDISTSPRKLLRMYNVSYIREIDFAHHLPLVHHDQTTNQGPVPETFPNPLNPMSPCPTESRAANDFNNNVQENILPNPPTFNSTPLPPKLNEICICEDTPDPYCPVHRRDAL